MAWDDNDCLGTGRPLQAEGSFKTGRSGEVTFELRSEGAKGTRTQNSKLKSSR